LVAAASVVIGCSSGPPRTRGPEARSELNQLAASQQQAPTPPPVAIKVESVPGVEGSLLAPVSATDLRAREPRETVLDELRSTSDGEKRGPAEPRQTPDALARDAALRLYMDGRTSLLRGQYKEAINQLQSATRLDSSSPAPWECLGEAQLRSGMTR